MYFSVNNTIKYSCDSAALRTLTATRQPMRADGNADVNGDASDGNAPANEG